MSRSTSFAADALPKNVVKFASALSAALARETVLVAKFEIDCPTPWTIPMPKLNAPKASPADVPNSFMDAAPFPVDLAALSISDDNFEAFPVWKPLFNCVCSSSTFLSRRSAAANAFSSTSINRPSEKSIPTLKSAMSFCN